MSRLILTSLIAGAAFLGSPQSFAECNLDTTAEECLEIVNEALRGEGLEIMSDEADVVIEETKQATATTAEDALRIFNTGISSALNDGGVSTLEDFLPKFKIFGSGGGLGEDDESLLLELNNIFSLPTDNGYKIRATLNRPVVFEPLLQSVPEDMRSNEKSTLEGQLNDFDDVTFAFIYSPMTEKWGRSNHQLHSDTFEELFVSAENHAGAILIDAENARDAADTALEEALDAKNEVILKSWSDSGAGYCGEQLSEADVLNIISGIDFDSLSGNQLLCAALSADASMAAAVTDANTAEKMHAVDPAKTEVIRQYLSAVESAIREEYTNLAILNENLHSAGFYRFADLINNQPQLNFAASFSSRDPLVGQDEFNLKISYEMGFVNVNNFRKFVNSSCQFDQTYLCFAEYLTPANEQHLKRGDRLSFNVEYSHKQSYDEILQSGLGSLMLDSESSLIASLAYGRYLSFLADGGGNSRFELSASYEDVDSDSTRQDRLFSTATYSQRISATAAVSFSIVYANKAEFRGDVGTEISAQLGLNYKMFSPKDF